jgi:hypothetical protein
MTTFAKGRPKPFSATSALLSPAIFAALPKPSPHFVTPKKKKKRRRRRKKKKMLHLSRPMGDEMT